MSEATLSHSVRASDGYTYGHGYGGGGGGHGGARPGGGPGYGLGAGGVSGGVGADNAWMTPRVDDSSSSTVTGGPTATAAGPTAARAGTDDAFSTPPPHSHSAAASSGAAAMNGAGSVGGADANRPALMTQGGAGSGGGGGGNGLTSHSDRERERDRERADEYHRDRDHDRSSGGSGRDKNGDASTVTITTKRKLELEQDAKDAKRYETESVRYKWAIHVAAQAYVCLITEQLPFNPVTAEDGQVYDRSAIEEHIRMQGGDLKSPFTGETMGPRLLPAVQARKFIRSLVESGAVDGELVEEWKQKVKVEETRKKADEGDVDAMCDLGKWYALGTNGLSVDKEISYKWVKKASDLHSARGMAAVGYRLTTGEGVEKNVAYGVALTAGAATLGSDGAAYNLGSWHHDGRHDIPKDASQAKYWYRKVVDGSCSVKHAGESTREKAAESLRHLLEGNETSGQS